MQFVFFDLIAAFLLLHHATAQCLKRPGERYGSHFLLYRLDENACVQKCETNVKCYRITWMRGSCYLHGDTVLITGKDVNTTGYICKARCLKFPGEKYSPHFEELPLGERDCLERCESDVKCYRITWISGRCYLHGDTVHTRTDVNSIGYICNAKCLKRPGERYSPHFEVLGLDESDCMKKCKSNAKCHRATWLHGNCYLHGGAFETGKDVNSIGYICKAKCIERIGESYSTHFVVSRLDKNECMINCENNIKCYRATWITGDCYLHGEIFETGRVVNSTGYICKAKCLKRPEERYSPHFEELRLGEYDCIKKCENNAKCYRATWISGSCLLHGDKFNTVKDVNTTGYICKADCEKNGQKFTSQKYQLTSNCTERCTCTLVGKSNCKKSCKEAIVNCVNPEVKVQHNIPLEETCFCPKHGCVVPGNFNIKAKQGKTIVLGCSFSTSYWTFNGKALKNNTKYHLKHNSMEVQNVQTTDTGTYTCGDKKYYNIHLTEDTCSSTSTIYIVVCAVTSFLVVVLLIILFIYKYKNIERAKKNNNTKARVEIPAPEINDVEYMELNEPIRVSYTGLNASNVATYENPPDAYEVSPTSLKRENLNNYCLS